MQRGVMAEYNKYRTSVSTTGDFSAFQRFGHLQLGGHILNPIFVGVPAKKRQSLNQAKIQVIQFLTFFYPQRLEVT